MRPLGPEHRVGDGCVGDVCITCSDVAVPVRIMSLYGYELAIVRTEAGTDEEISVALVDAVVGDVVLVHAKEAIARVGAALDGAGLDGAARVGAALDRAGLDGAGLDGAGLDGPGVEYLFGEYQPDEL